MSLWSIAEVSKIMGCSPQNIYQKKAKLKSMGASKLNKTCLNDIENVENTSDSSIKQDFIFQFLQEQVEDLKKQLADEREKSKYWQDLYIKENENFKKVAFPIMLDTEAGNRQTEEKHKKGFWTRFFN